MRKASIALIAGAALVALAFAVWDADAQAPAADPVAKPARTPGAQAQVPSPGPEAPIAPD